MADKDNKLEMILENKSRYQSRSDEVDLDEDFDELDEVVNEIAELICEAPDEEKPKILKELSDGLRREVYNDVFMSQLYAHSKDRNS